MSVQTGYNFATPVGIAGGIFDLTDYTIDTRVNEENTGAMGLGVGVFQGTVPGANIKLPSGQESAATFEGFTVNGFTNMHDLEGVVALKKGQAVGVMRKGRLWVKLATGKTLAYGASAKLVVSGDDKGCVSDTGLEIGAVVCSKASGNGLVAIELK